MKKITIKSKKKKYNITLNRVCFCILDDIIKIEIETYSSDEVSCRFYIEESSLPVCMMFLDRNMGLFEYCSEEFNLVTWVQLT